MNFGKPLLFVFIFIFLVLSVVFSVKSFTGYLISDISNNSANLTAFLFLIFGVMGTWLYVFIFKNR